MTTYTLEINIDQDDVKHFNSDGYSLCFASGVGSSNASNVVFDVVASTKGKWADLYQIRLTG
jgi:hypothetical protein